MFVTGAGTNRIFIELNRVYSFLSSTSECIIGYTYSSGCDVTGCFKNKGKLSFWKAFEAAEEETPERLGRLGCLEEFKTVDKQRRIEQFICQVCSPARRF